MPGESGEMERMGFGLGIVLRWVIAVVVLVPRVYIRSTYPESRIN